MESKLYMSSLYELFARKNGTVSDIEDNTLTWMEIS